MTHLEFDCSDEKGTALLIAARLFDEGVLPVDWYEVSERLPSGYIEIDDDAGGYREPAEYIVQIGDAELATFAMFDGEKFVPSFYRDPCTFADPVKRWAYLPNVPRRNN